MRERLTGLGVPCPRFAPVRGLADVEEFAAGSWPVVLKAVSGGYDGKGVWVVRVPARGRRRRCAHGRDGWRSWPRSGSRSPASSPCSRPARRTGQGAVYPVVQTVQRDGICREVIAPAPGLAPGLAAQAQNSRCGSRPSSG